jgi:hypothetical protein
VNGDVWPELPLEAWHDTFATLHLWTQIVGKVRLARTPWTNHSWHVTLYVTPRGLTTSPIPDGERTFGSIRLHQPSVDHRDERRTVCGTCRSSRNRWRPSRASWAMNALGSCASTKPSEMPDDSFC